jgi:hypothetical protein
VHTDSCKDGFITTSYDYSAPITESGSAGVGRDGVNKFSAIRDLLSKYTNDELPALPESPRIASLGSMELLQVAFVLDSLPSLCKVDGVESNGADSFSWIDVPEGQGPKNMEQYHQSRGIILYRFAFEKPFDGGGAHTLTLPEVRDVAYIFVNGRRVSIVQPPGNPHEITLLAGQNQSESIRELDILVENKGRFHNLGWYQSETQDTLFDKNRKGLVGGPVLLDGHDLLSASNAAGPLTAGQWRVCPMSLEHGSQGFNLDWSGIGYLQESVKRQESLPIAPFEGLELLMEQPLLIRGNLELTSGTMADSFAWLDGFNEGAAWINGQALGRFSSQGPQHDLFVPKPWLREGANELIILELRPSDALQATIAGTKKALEVPFRAERLQVRKPESEPVVERAFDVVVSVMSIVTALMFAFAILGFIAFVILCLCGNCGGKEAAKEWDLPVPLVNGSENSLSLRTLSLDPEILLDTPVKRHLYSCWKVCSRCYPALMIVGGTLAVILLGYWHAQRAFLIITIWYVYLMVHQLRVAIFGWKALGQMRRHTQTDWKSCFITGDSEYDSEDSEDSEDSDARGDPEEWDKVLHLVFMPNYKEEPEILQEALDALAHTPNAQRRIGICLAMEEREAGSHEKASKLMVEYVKRFRFIEATFHPPDLPGERPGKCSNMAWAFPNMRRMLQTCCPDVPQSMIITTVIDADSELHPRYFDYLTYSFLRKDLDARQLALWLPAVMHFKNYRRQPWLVRIMSVFCSINELACLSDPCAPNGFLVTYSTYSLSLDLFASTGGVDPFWIAEDWHCTVKAILKTCGAARCEPVHLPVCNYTPEGETACETIYLRWDQAKRHMLGVTEVVYFFWSAWLAFLELPTLKARCSFCLRTAPLFWKLWHVYFLAGYGWLPFIGMLLGSFYQFSAWCDMGVPPNPLLAGSDPYCPLSVASAEHSSFGASERSILNNGWLLFGGIFGLFSAICGITIDILMVFYYDEFGGSSYPGAERGTGSNSAQDEGNIGGLVHFIKLFSAMCIAALPASILFGYIPTWIGVLSVAWSGVHFTHSRTPKKIVEGADALPVEKA